MHEEVVSELRNWEHAKAYLGKHKYYPDFLRFFQLEIEKKGWREVVAEYVFSGKKEAEEIFGRVFVGEFRPLLFAVGP